MPVVILRGGKNGRRVSRVVLEGSSSNPTRYLDINGEPVLVSDEEFDKLGHKYVLEEAQFPDAPDDLNPTPPEAPEASETSEPSPPAEGDTEDDPEKGGVK